jgi:hypothetical protein
MFKQSISGLMTIGKTKKYIGILRFDCILDVRKATNIPDLYITSFGRY